MTEGLIQGLLKGQNALLAAAEKLMTSLQDKLSNMLSKSSSFGQGIEGGFSSLFDISGAAEAMNAGMNPQEFFQQKAWIAQQFSDVLKALAAQGAGKALLADIAGMGPEGIPFAQGLLQQGPAGITGVNKAYNDIARIAEKLDDSLTNRFFGEKLADLRHDVKDQKDVLVDIRQNVKFLEKISDQLSNGDRGAVHITVNGWVGNDAALAKKIRDELKQLGDRNVSTGIQ